jgi:hypothetical protein
MILCRFRDAGKVADIRKWPLAEMPAAARHSRLPRVSLPAVSAFVNPDSAHYWRTTGRGARRVGHQSFPLMRQRPLMRRAVAPGPMPVVRTAARPSNAATMASGARIKPGEALHREPLDAANVLLDVPRRVLSWRARTDGVFWDRE